MSVTLYLAIPCYNEEAVLPETARRLREKFTALRAAGTIGPMSRICFIDDGSKDATWQLISDLHARDPVFSGIRLLAQPRPPERAAVWPDDAARPRRLRYLHGRRSAGRH